MRAVQFDGPLNRPNCGNTGEKREPEGDRNFGLVL